jgi:hypothetical protein
VSTENTHDFILGQFNEQGGTIPCSILVKDRVIAANIAAMGLNSESGLRVNVQLAGTALKQSDIDIGALSDAVKCALSIALLYRWRYDRAYPDVPLEPLDTMLDEVLRAANTPAFITTHDRQQIINYVKRREPGAV